MFILMNLHRMAQKAERLGLSGSIDFRYLFTITFMFLLCIFDSCSRTRKEYNGKYCYNLAGVKYHCDIYNDDTLLSSINYKSDSTTKDGAYYMRDSTIQIGNYENDKLVGNFYINDINGKPLTYIFFDSFGDTMINIDYKEVQIDNKKTLAVLGNIACEPVKNELLDFNLRLMTLNYSPPLICQRNDVFIIYDGHVVRPSDSSISPDEVVRCYFFKANRIGKNITVVRDILWFDTLNNKWDTFKITKQMHPYNK